MRQLKTLCLAACVGLALMVSRTNASEGFDDIAKLAKSGITEDVLVAFVQASPVAYELSVDEILFLNDLGVTSKSIQEILNHGKDVRSGTVPVITETPIDNNRFGPLDDTQATPVNLANFDGDRAQALPVDQNNADSQTGYVSPLTGDVSYTPEVYHEKEIVRETVYTPTPVTACNECSISHFYEALTPYGTWVNLDGSWCWQPAVGCSDSAWQPYGNRGHWAWTDSGWCWESDYSWGWAPFHYGRWWRAPGYGWMWHPDTVWGPAWVNWRQNESHWGWAPLPPAARFETGGAVGVGFHFGGRHWGLNVGLDFGLSERDYCFVPQDRFCDRNLNTYFVGRDQRVAIYSQTTVIQNNIIIQNNNVFVNGPSYRVVEERTHRPLVQLRIADNDIGNGQVLVRASYNDREHNTLRFYRPRISATAVETPVEIAARQVARNAGNVQPVADPRVLAASARADELRERHFATQDARRQESLTRQSALVEEASARRADNEQHRLTTLMGKTDNAQQKAAFAAQATAERQRAEEARQQKAALEKQAADQRRMTEQLAIEQNRVAHATANAESARQAEAAKAELVAQRMAREQANKQAAAMTEKALADQRARNASAKITAKGDAEARTQALEAENKARLDAQRQAREANRQAQEQILARQKAQMEADRAARAKAAAEKPANPARINADPNAGRVPPARVNTDPNPVTKQPREVIRTPEPANNAAAERAAAMEAQRLRNEANRAAAEKAAADRAAAAKAEREAIKTEREKPRVVVPPPQPANNGAAERAAAMEAQRLRNEANRDAAEKAAADRAAAAKAEREAIKAEREKPRVVVPPQPLTQPIQPTQPVQPPAVRQLINPKTGQPYNPNDPNDPNNPRKRN